MAVVSVARTAREHVVLGVAVGVFAVSVAVTVIWCGAMAAMPGMPMPGGWTMSMAWMRMPGQTWSAAAGMFLGMWMVMMVAMMLPSLVPMLGRYRRGVGRGASGPGRHTLYVAVAYFLVWTLLGAAVYPLGVGLAAACMRWPALASVVPAAIGATVLAAGLLQFTSWKLRQLACCRGAVDLGPRVPATGAGAWCHGLRLGFHCAGCCGGLMLILLVMGVMDLRAMAVVTAAITVERLAPAGEGVARAVGAAAVVTGLYLMLP